MTDMATLRRAATMAKSVRVRRSASLNRFACWGRNESSQYLGEVHLRISKPSYWPYSHEDQRYLANWRREATASFASRQDVRHRQIR